MRLRHKPWALPEMQEDRKFFLDPFEMKGKWQAEFGNQNPIDLEVGCGRGDFITALAKAEPNRNYLALDLKNEVLVYALRKINEAGLDNVRIISGKADDLDRMLGEGEIDDIYINFANPWPKPTHNKRRLTHPRFLALYRLFTKEDSKLEFKTDDEAMYLDSLEYFPEAGYEITFQTQDLDRHHPNNIETEYEAKFRDFGMPIFRIDAKKVKIPKAKLDDLLSYKRKAMKRVGRPHWDSGSYKK